MPYFPPPKILKAFPDAQLTKPKTKIANTNKLRKRWQDSSYIYEWDYQHGAVEKYDKNGQHLGEFNPETGQQKKPANPHRSIEV